jgi:hypothetical protein
MNPPFDEERTFSIVSNHVLEGVSLCLDYALKNRSTSLIAGSLKSASTTTFKIVNSNGKEVLATKFSIQKINEISLPKSLSIGVYIVPVVAESGTFYKREY